MIKNKTCYIIYKTIYIWTLQTKQCKIVYFSMIDILIIKLKLFKPFTLILSYFGWMLAVFSWSGWWRIISVYVTVPSLWRGWSLPPARFTTLPSIWRSRTASSSPLWPATMTRSPFMTVNRGIQALSVFMGGGCKKSQLYMYIHAGWTARHFYM